MDLKHFKFKLFEDHYALHITFSYFDINYSATSIIRAPLSKAPVMWYRISEIVQITEVLTFLSFYDMHWYKTALLLQRKLQKDS